MYTYRFRPGYGSDKLLIEFVRDAGDAAFLTDLKAALSHIEMKVVTREDLWMNDEVLYGIDSSEGKFILSQSIWGCAFIMADENQQCIYRIDEILTENENFIREEVDFSEYESVKE